GPNEPLSHCAASLIAPRGTRTAIPSCGIVKPDLQSKPSPCRRGNVEVLQRVDRELAAMVAGRESDWVASSVEAGVALSTCRMAISSLVGWLTKLSRPRSPPNHPTAIANGIPVALTACRSPLKQIHSLLKQIHINRNRSQCQASKATPRDASKRHAGF